MYLTMTKILKPCIHPMVDINLKIDQCFTYLLYSTEQSQVSRGLLFQCLKEIYNQMRFPGFLTTKCSVSICLLKRGAGSRINRWWTPVPTSNQSTPNPTSNQTKTNNKSSNQLMAIMTKSIPHVTIMLHPRERLQTASDMLTYTDI